MATVKEFLGSVSDRALGVVYTPPKVVDFMVSLVEPCKDRLRVLEPACADAPFLRAFSDRYGSHHEFVGVEIDSDRLSKARGCFSNADFLETDFLLWDSDVKFDVVIGNPPYGIIGDASHYPIHVLKDRKSLYRQRSQTWRGKYNIYGLFIERAVELLEDGGQLVFVVPASWLVLDDFVLLRKYLADRGRLSVYYLGKVFPKRNVSVVVLKFEKCGRGLLLYNVNRLVWQDDNYDGGMIRFENPKYSSLEREYVSVGELFEIRFAARSTEISRHAKVSKEPKSGYVPVLTGRNLGVGCVDYETCYSGYWFPHDSVAELREFYSFPHLVVAHTKGTRVVAAVDDKCYPWREEFHLVPKVDGLGLHMIADALNRSVVQQYCRYLYLDFVPHLTRSMLERVPLLGMRRSDFAQKEADRIGEN